MNGNDEITRKNSGMSIDPIPFKLTSTVDGLTPELSRAAKRRRLGRIVRPHAATPAVPALLLQLRSEPSCQLHSLLRGVNTLVPGMKPITVVTWNHVLMVVPHILVASWAIVLAR